MRFMPAGGTLTAANSFAGTAPGLAACKHLHKAGLLGPDVPGKVRSRTCLTLHACTL